MANLQNILFKGLREEGEEGEEGFLDEGENLKEITRSLLMVDNNKAELFGGYLARHFFRGVSWVIFISFICSLHKISSDLKRSVIK